VCVSVFFAVETLVCLIFLTYFTRDTGLNGVVARAALCKIIND